MKLPALTPARSTIRNTKSQLRHRGPNRVGRSLTKAAIAAFFITDEPRVSVAHFPTGGNRIPAVTTKSALADPDSNGRLPTLVFIYINKAYDALDLLATKTLADNCFSAVILL